MTTSKDATKTSATMRFLDDLIGEPLSFGNMLSTLRQCESWSQAEMAHRLQVTPQHLGQVEKGRKAVTPERAAKWARELGQSEAQFVTLALQAQLDEAGLDLRVAVTSEPPRRPPRPAKAESVPRRRLAG